ncbi:hypothetical protein [Pelagivirga sediminicola]|uniref:hypothetical protein n=1 Tax=Pelagivirga sediminicola TaxID=2170575 RepID=UPI0010572C52|nr:hypothetical protein [Pelagivirga sediminicola]
MFFKSIWIKAVCCCVAFSITSPLLAKSWEQAIADVEAMSDSFLSIAEAKGFNEPLGTAYNEVDVSMHLCAILGRMVGHKEAIFHLEPPQPSPSATGRDFAIAAVSLSNWVIAAKYHSSIDADTKSRLWNLDCIGRHGIPQGLYVEVPSGHSIVFDPNRRAIMIQGDITAGFADTVAQAIREYPEAKVVSLGSGGGAVYEALRAGRLIRSAELETELINGCYSACPLAMAGGTIRFMWWPFEELGLHEVSAYGVALPPSASVYNDIALYLTEMGIDASQVLPMMWSAPPSGMYLVKEQERCDTRLVTNHQRGCLAF